MIKIECKLSKYGPQFYFVFRLLVGLLFAVHGAQKFGIIGDGSISGFAEGMGVPLFLAIIAGLIELVGGLAIALGVFTRHAAFLGTIVMVVAYILAHMPKGILPWSNGGEKVLLYIAAFLALIAKGKGKYSIK